MKLCYKEYDVRITIEDILNFKRKTGKDLYATVLGILAVFIETKGAASEAERMAKLHSAIDFETASFVFSHCLKFGGYAVSVDEARDAMFRVGWRLHDDDNEWMQPYPLVLVELAFELDRQFGEVVEAKKKAATSVQ